MTTVISSIILDAYRESNILPLAQTVPTTAQSTEALRLYNAILSNIYGSDMGELLQDFPLGNFGRDSQFNYCPITANDPYLLQPPINSRLVAVNDAAITIDFPALPQDGARMAIIDPFGRLAAFPVTLNGNGRTITTLASVVLNTNSARSEWIFRADLGDWVISSPVALTDMNPFPSHFDQMFVILLALRLNPRYGRDLSDMSQSILKQGRAEFIARYLNAQDLRRDASISWPFMSKQGDGYSRSFSSTPGFNRGSIYG